MDHKRNSESLNGVVVKGLMIRIVKQAASDLFSKEDEVKNQAYDWFTSPVVECHPGAGDGLTFDYCWSAIYGKACHESYNVGRMIADNPHIAHEVSRLSMPELIKSSANDWMGYIEEMKSAYTNPMGRSSGSLGAASTGGY